METAALITRPVISSDKYLRKLEGPSLSISFRKRKAPVPSTSKSDVANSTLGKRAIELGNAVKSGDPHGNCKLSGNLFNSLKPIHTGFRFGTSD